MAGVDFLMFGPVNYFFLAPNQQRQRQFGLPWAMSATQTRRSDGRALISDGQAPIWPSPTEVVTGTATVAATRSAPAPELEADCIATKQLRVSPYA